MFDLKGVLAVARKREEDALASQLRLETDLIARDAQILELQEGIKKLEKLLQAAERRAMAAVSPRALGELSAMLIPARRVTLRRKIERSSRRSSAWWQLPRVYLPRVTSRLLRLHQTTRQPCALQKRELRSCAHSKPGIWLRPMHSGMTWQRRRHALRSWRRRRTVGSY